MSNPILLWVMWIGGSPGRSWASKCWRPVRSGPKSESLVQIRSKQASPWDCCSPWCKRWGDLGGCCRGLLCNSGRWRSGCRSPSAVASAEEPSVLQSVLMCSPSRRLNLQQERMITQQSYTVAWCNSRGATGKVSWTSEHDTAINDYQIHRIRQTTLWEMLTCQHAAMQQSYIIYSREWCQHWIWTGSVVSTPKD